MDLTKESISKSESILVYTIEFPKGFCCQFPGQSIFLGYDKLQLPEGMNLIGCRVIIPGYPECQVSGILGERLEIIPPWDYTLSIKEGGKIFILPYTNYQ